MISHSVKQIEHCSPQSTKSTRTFILKELFIISLAEYNERLRVYSVDGKILNLYPQRWIQNFG